MKFEKIYNKRQNVYCEYKTTHPKQTRSALWEGTWLGWPLGLFCTDCREEWERMKEDVLT